MKPNINHVVHQVVLEHITPTSICVDATCGNGFDTIFLAQNSAKVYAFDIQQDAINKTKQKAMENNLHNIEFVHDSHDTVDHYVHYPIDIAMFNLGYLPSGDKSIITTPKITLSAVEKIINFLPVNGLITITVYIGHPGGKLESDAILNFTSTLDKHQFTVVRYEHINRLESPYAIFIEKIR